MRKVEAVIGTKVARIRRWRTFGLPELMLHAVDYNQSGHDSFHFLWYR